MIVWRLSFIFQEVKVGLVAQSMLSVTACLKWVSKMKRRFCPYVFFRQTICKNEHEYDDSKWQPLVYNTFFSK